MRLRLALIAVLLGALALNPVATSAAPPATNLDLSTPITGTGPNGVTFAGTFNLDRITTQNGALAAVGTLTGTLTSATGAVLGTVNQALTLPLNVSAVACEILHLELGPLDLNLLGLMIHLDKVVLDITAQPGPGNLLGNLLCAIAGLLDSNAPLNTLARLLNQLLSLLG